MEMNMFYGYGKWPLFHVFALTFILRGNCNFIERPVDTQVFVGDSTYFNCSISNSASAQVFWYHTAVGEGTSVTTTVYSSGKILHPYAGRFKIEKEVSTGQFNLVVRKTELSDAGAYVCQIGGTAKSTIAQLTVLESNPVCVTNISRALIGETSYSIENEKIRLSCSIIYKGNVTPKLQWTQVKNNALFPVKESLLSCSSSDVSVNCNYTTEAEIEIDGSYFICYTITSKNIHRRCRTDAIKIQGNSTFIERPVDTTVLLGDSTYLNCSISSSASAEVSWYHSPVGEGTSNMTAVYSSGKVLNPYTGRFKIEKGALKGTFDLVIKRAKLRDAGFYVCQVAGTTKRTIAQLTVLESGPLLLTNIRPSGFIGRNSCGLKSERIRLSCGIRYKGNVTPKLQVTLVQVQNGEPIAEEESNLSCSSSDVSVNCNYSTEAENVMDGSFFICYTNTSENTHLKNRTDIIKILYLMNSRVTELKSLGEEVECPLHGNTEDKCSYKWFMSTDDGSEMISTDRTLTITEDRRYRCITTCYIKGNKCIIDAIIIETRFVDSMAWLFGMALCICSMVFFYLLLRHANML